jgi:hypothetical protein
MAGEHRLMFTAMTIQDAAGVDVPLINTNRTVEEVAGLHGLPSPRRLVRSRPGAHGEINTTKHYDSRQPVLNGVIFRDSEDGLWSEYETILGALWGAVENERLLKWTREDSTALQTHVKLAAAFDPVLRAVDSGMFLRYQLAFDREDPRNYSQTQDAEVGEPLADAAGGLTFPAPLNWQFSASGAGEITVDNTGTIDTPGIFRIYGYATSPQILNMATGERIAVNGTVSAGDYLEVDIADRSALLNSETDRTNLIDFSGTDWAAGEIVPGETTFRLIAGNFDASARLDVLFRAAYA